MTEPDQHSRPVAVVVLAAGSGTRMKSKLVKVLHPVCGRSMVGHVLTAALHVDPAHVVAVVGHSREQVGQHILEQVPGALLAVQESQDGTGHAVRVALDTLREAAGTTDGVVVVMAGDTPLMQGETLAGLVQSHSSAAGLTKRAVTVLTAEVADPFGYGRVLRDADGSVTAIVEERDATPSRPRSRRSTAASTRSTGPSSRTRCLARPTTTPRASTTSPTWSASRTRTAARSVRTASTT